MTLTLLVGLAFSAAMVTQALAADKSVIGYSAPGLVGAQAQI